MRRESHQKLEQKRRERAREYFNEIKVVTCDRTIAENLMFRVSGSATAGHTEKG